MENQAKTILKEIFGYDEFRPLQEEIIENILKKNDSLIIMPTGGGKSICYQIPALIFEGLTIVISPLISLMKDQVEQLNELGVNAVFLNSSLSFEEYRFNVERIKKKEIKLLYLAPETLLMPKTLSLLSSIDVDCFTVDEAHCISEWGHDFRPEYRQIIDIRSQFPSAVCMALTATATPRVRQDIKDNLRFDDSNEFIASFNRENLYLQIVPKTDPLSQTIEFLEKYKDQSGIIYCFSRKQVDELYEILENEGFSVKSYHAGMSDSDRRKNQELFIRDDVQIIIATIAFGMGINKPNIRFVIHYDLPKNIESYYQEIGRSGRDGLRAHCLLLFGYGDIQKIKYFINQKEDKDRRIANVHLNALLQFAETETCRRIPLLTYFGEDYSEKNCAMCDNCLAGEKQLVDITIPSQMFLSCIKRTDEIFGVNHIIDVLRGSQSQKVIKFGHQNLSTYDIGKDYSKKQWFHLSRQFIQKDLMIQEAEFGSLKLTNKAYNVLKGKETVMGLIEEERVDFKREKEIELEYDRGLFEILRKTRKEIADNANVPPYVIFPDKTLIEMAAYFPQSAESLLDIHGVGSAKFKKYGGLFLDLIGQYCLKNQINELPKRKPRRRTSRGLSKPLHSKRHFMVGEEYNIGKSLEEIMIKYKFKQSTLLSHLYKYLLEGYPLRGDGFLKLSTIPQSQADIVIEAFDRLGTEYLKPVFEALNE
ncbi:MAG: DNA helicase RecQ, partial [Calditrichales bacterium]|nr:DNA helicase RecQ [Calditrichales bacterium]